MEVQIVKRELLAKTLKLKRNAVGMTQSQLSKNLGYECSQFVSNWERAISMPPMNAVDRLSQLLRIPAFSLLKLIHAAYAEERWEKMLREYSEAGGNVEEYKKTPDIPVETAGEARDSGHA